MPRLLVLALFLAAGAPTALAQIGQFPGVISPAPAPPGVVPPPPPVIYSPKLNSPLATPNVMMPVPPVHARRPVLVPAAPPGRNSFSDRVERCMHAGRAAGIRPNDLGSFTSQCAN
jgi:hypothetical protein